MRVVHQRRQLSLPLRAGHRRQDLNELDVCLGQLLLQSRELKRRQSDGARVLHRVDLSRRCNVDLRRRYERALRLYDKRQLLW